MDNLPRGMGVYAFRNGQLRLIYQNRSCRELAGLRGDKSSDLVPLSAIHPDDVSMVMEKLTRAIERNEDVICDVRLRHSEHGYRFARLVARVVPHE